MESSPWPLRRERLYAVAGDSPLGFRLPLGSLPDVLPEDVEHDAPVDPFAPRGRAAASATALTASATRGRAPAKVEPREVIKTALVRRGARRPLVRVHAAAAQARGRTSALHRRRSRRRARELGMPVLVEGYPPPRDPRIARLHVTPDPGVIEVNVHPASTWRELDRHDARCCTRKRARRASATEKFMLDGRHTGTGGGNHVTLGGATPADSPLLRRPDLLQSLITYWQNHPALSYLFSGMFVGPTSQAPRVDEARDDRLYELEIAFQQLDRVARRRQGDRAAVARRPAAAPPADRPHRQHASRRILDRQALFARHCTGPAGSARVPRVRDAAALRG